MPPKSAKGGPNQKVEAGRALQAANAAKQQAALDQQQAQRDAAEWAVGSNAKRATREQELAAKNDEAARKRREKAELLAAEELALNTGTTATAKKAELTAKKKKANQKRNDLALLEDALVSAADKKAKKKKAAELLAQREQQEQRAAAKKKEPEQFMDPLLANTEQMIGASLDDDVVYDGRRANQARMEETAGSGLEAALESLNVSVGPKLVSAKALYAAFEERMLPQVKADHPGLRLSQYKEKVWVLWKKAPENPANQQQLSADATSP